MYTPQVAPPDQPIQEQAMDGYYDHKDMPVNPFDLTQKRSRHAIGDLVSNIFSGGAKSQFDADMKMAEYNQQVAEKQLLKQREWALQDRDYNSPAELRKRLEDAGYNPALMSGAIQTANQPVRGSTSSTPSGHASSVGGFSNLIQAGKSVVDSMLTAKNMRKIDADIQEVSSRTTKNLSDAAFTKSQQNKVDKLIDYDVQAASLANQRSTLEYQVRLKYYNDIMPRELEKLRSGIDLDYGQIQKWSQDLNLQGQLTDAQVGQIKQLIKESSDRILTNEEVRKQISQALALGEEELARSIIETEVAKGTKGAKIAKEYVDIAVDGISSFIGVGKFLKAGQVTPTTTETEELDSKGRRRSFKTTHTYGY